jgi:triphosphoribosyl-dephospho-CoA synthase
MLSVGLAAQLACIWEATARKPGNVHRYCDFSDASYLDFIASAAAIAPVLETARQRRVGETILEGVRATRSVVATNTNLGILLLLAPLATVPAGTNLRAGATRVLEDLDVTDARTAYEAIRLAAPGGLGQVAEQDVRKEPEQTLRQVMQLAADRDLVARQYATAFEDVFDDGVPALRRGLELCHTLEDAVVFCHLKLMDAHPDTLIARKRGPQEAKEAAARARQVLQAGWPHSPESARQFYDLDAWLRAEGRGRNPGTTADLVTASLFVALQEEILTVPARRPWASGTGSPEYMDSGQRRYLS